VSFALTALAAAAAVAVELLEALAIVLAVGVTRRWHDAAWGAAAGVLGCAVLAALLGPLLVTLPRHALELAIGTLLLLYGLEWLRKATLRLSGRKARASSAAEYDETVEEFDDVPLPPVGTPDWPARIIAGKGVLLEGVEVVAIVAALAARPTGSAPALLGAGVATVAVIAAGILLREPLGRLPETELKYGVGVLLTTFGTFFAGEGLRVAWPGGELSVVLIGLILVAVTQLQIRSLRVQAAPA
jgi:uncharacterized membrane protein